MNILSFHILMNITVIIQFRGNSLSRYILYEYLHIIWFKVMWTYLSYLHIKLWKFWSGDLDRHFMIWFLYWAISYFVGWICELDEIVVSGMLQFHQCNCVTLQIYGIDFRVESNKFYITKMLILYCRL